MLTRLLLTAALTTLAIPAQAQIYSWRDDSGTLVLSNKPREGAAPVDAAAPGTQVTSPPASNPSRHKKHKRKKKHHHQHQSHHH